jgi:thiol-disulfide isomerase/thioredoxin
MKIISWSSCALAAAALLISIETGFAAEGSDPEVQLKLLVEKIQGKLQAGERTEAALAAEIKEFDALLEEHKGTKTEAVAQILFMKAMLYTQVFEDAEKGIVLVEQVGRDFPDTERGKHAQQMVPALRKQAALGVGKVFPDFNEKDLDGQPLSLARFKGKVVLVDFWATWCGPCIAELPHVLSTYRKHHDEGFEIVGISLDSDREKLNAFIKERGMTWPQYFDGQGWQTKLAQEYGVNSIPATFLLDAEGKVIAKGLRGEALEEAVAKALAKR